MSKAKHTSGEWHVHDEDRALIVAGGRIIAEAKRRVGREEVEANALLISASPELIEACRLAAQRLAEVQSIVEKYDDSKINEAERFGAEQQCWDAIAKAEGMDTPF